MADYKGNMGENVVDDVSQMWYTQPMDKDTCLIYEGKFYKVEWYFDNKGVSQAYEYFLKVSAVQKRKFLILVKKIADFGTIFDTTKFRNEGDNIYAFKPQPDRYLCCFFEGKKIIVTNAYRKKSDKLPPGEKSTALKNREAYKQAVSTKKENEE